jgi:hypothetical protein
MAVIMARFELRVALSSNHSQSVCVCVCTSLYIAFVFAIKNMILKWLIKERHAHWSSIKPFLFMALYNNKNDGAAVQNSADCQPLGSHSLTHSLRSTVDIHIYFMIIELLLMPK